MNEKVYLAALHKIGINHKKLFIIFSNKNNYKDFYENLSFSLLKKAGFSDSRISEIIKNKSKIDLDKLSKKIIDLDVKIIDYSDLDYPELLKNIHNKPFLIYLRGKLSFPGIAFVGSRNITSYGKNIIEKILPDVGKYFTIISGGAYGCDSYSHKIALDNGINTIAVVGTGIDINYPSVNENMYRKIIDSDGGVLSIFPFGEQPNPYNFPVRNEIVACLSRGIVIIEAREKSGSLITANLGLEQGKDIFCIPGDIFRVNSFGCNNFISKGLAKSISSSKDILLEYNISSNIKKIIKKVIIDDILEKKIFDLILIESMNIDEIRKKMNLDITIILLKISMLELNNLIRKSEFGKYEII